MGDDFERAVLVSLNPTQVSPQTLQGAQALLAQFKASGDAWKLCLQKAFSDCPMQVRFFCFLTLVDLLNHKCVASGPSSWASFIYIRDFLNSLTFY
jgi:hypothetical protein